MQDSPAISSAYSLWRTLLAAGLGALLALLGAAVLALGFAHDHPTAQAGLRHELLFGLAAVGLLATIGSVWLLRRLEALGRQVLGAQSRQQQLLELVDDWYWRTDAAHRLSLLRPPPGTPAGHSPLASPLGTTLWDEFLLDAPDLAAQQERMQACAAFGPCPAQRRETSGRLTQWRLRGQPCFDDAGRFSGYEGVAREVTQQAELAFAEQALRRLLDRVPSAALLAQRDPGSEPPRFVLIHCNAAAARHLGDSAERLRGRELLPLLRQASDWPLERVHAALGLPDETSPPRPPSAAPWQVEAERLPMRPGGVEQEGLLLVCTSGAAATDGEAQQLERQAVQQELESFSYTVSHDLRAPIRVVEGFAKILKEDHGPALDRVGNDHLDRILSATARMNQMIDALLALSRLSAQPLSRQRVNLSQLAGFIVEDLQRQSHTRQVEVRIRPGMSAEGDPVLLRVLLENLLGNAWKYTAKQERPLISFSYDTQGGRSVFWVRDNGAGFDMRFADRLFGAFQRLHSASDFPGTGVGLATVQRIVRRHGGQIWADAAVGQGATFFFTLAETRHAERP